jgi:PAS domain S-box-containing protein
MEMKHRPGRESRAKLARELEDAKQLQRISSLLIEDESGAELYEHILDAAMAIMHAEFGSIQMLDSERGELRLLACRNFHPESAAYWQSVSVKTGTACGSALQHGERIIVPDVNAADFLQGAEGFRHFGLSGIAAVQSTPLTTRDGRLIGMISTHWRQRHEPGEPELALFDVLVRQAADVLERRRAQEALRARESWLAGQKEAFEAAIRGAPLEESLGMLVRAALKHAGEDVRCAFYIADRAGRALRHVTGMSGSYSECVDGFKIGPDSLACGLAVYTGQPVITPDVNEAPRWQPWLWLAKKYEFRACWSFPVETSPGKAIGTFAMYFQSPREATQRDCEFAALLTRAAAIIISRNQEAEERSRAEAALRESEEALREMSMELRRILDTAATGLTHCSRDLRYLSANAAYAKWIGLPREQIAGRPIVDVMGQAAFNVIRPHIEKALQGQRVEFEAELPIEGSLKPIHVVYTPDRDATGCVVGWVASVTDISELKQREEQIQLLLREVNHRSKNLLALVEAVARHTAASNPDDFLERFGERVQAMAASQDLLVKSGWRGVELGELVRSQLAHFKDLIGSRIELLGPPLAISAPAAQAIGMALHELATNAGKYGALASGSGSIRIAWGAGSADGGGPVFTMSWRERGGPPVEAPARQGFGTAVLYEMTELSLGAEVGLDFETAGLTWQLRCPAEEILDESQPPAGRSAAAAPASVLAPARSGPPAILVVEDEPLVALEITHILKGAGFDIVGPARTLARGLELLRARGCDAAVLDINLGKETSEPVARELKERGTPFVALSGYAPEQHPPAFHGAPALAKPLRPEVLVAEVRRCVERKGHRPSI